MRTIYLHVGFPKTGTSAIQSYFSVNREMFKANGVLYPVSGDTYYAGQAGLALAAKRKLIEPFTLLKKEIDDSGCNSIVLSSEYFFMLEHESINFIRGSLSDFNIKIIVYFRRQDARIESGYLQVLRDSEFRFSGSIDDYIMYLDKYPRRTDYYLFLEPWALEFGKKSIVVSVYEEAKKHLISDFLDRCMFLEPSGAVNLSADVNVAYRPMVNKLLRRLNKIPMSPRKHILITKFFNYVTRKFLGPGNISDHKLLSDVRRLEINDRYNDSNAKVAREFLDREDGVLFK